MSLLDWFQTVNPKSTIEALLGDRIPAQNWTYGTTQVPRGTYRQAIMLLADLDGQGLFDGDLEQLCRDLEAHARKANFKLVQVVPLLRSPKLAGLAGYETMLFSGYVSGNQDAWIDWALGGTVADLRKAVGAAAVVVGDQDVTTSQRNEFDALWAAGSITEPTTPRPQEPGPSIDRPPTPGPKAPRNIDLWPTVGFGVLLGAVVLGIWALPEGKGK
jgi:hypothetical protein